MRIIATLVVLLLASPLVFSEGWVCSWTDEAGRSGTDLFVRDFYWGGESNDRVITTGCSRVIIGGLAGFFDSVAEKMIGEEISVVVVDDDNNNVGIINPAKIIRILFGEKKSE